MDLRGERVKDMPTSAAPSPVRSLAAPLPKRQRGWIGMAVVLLALVVVAFLYKDALTKYLGPAQTVPRAGPRTPVDSATGDATAPTPANAVDRARGLQDFMQKESQKRGGD